jgi:hypothetical protein
MRDSAPPHRAGPHAADPHDAKQRGTEQHGVDSHRADAHPGPSRRPSRKLIAALTASALATALGIVGATGLLAAPAQAATATGQITGYQGLCLDVRGAGNADGTAVQVYTCNGTNAQTWTLTSGNQLQALGKCLDVAGAGTANGTKVQLYTCNGTGAQVWQHQSNNEYINPNSGKCLDDTGLGGSGTQVQIWTCADSSNQQWSLP